MPSPFTGRLESTPDGHLSVVLNDGQILRISADQVHGPVMSGNPVRLFIVSQSNDGIGDTTLSQAMINELLNPPTP